MQIDAETPPGIKNGPVSEQTSGDVFINTVRHTFPNGFEALKSTTLTIQGGTFCTILGPSGSGKTTLLRAIAGLIRPTAGRIQVGGKDITDIPIQKRDIGFVFQHYALFPHMTVGENITYPLRIRRMKKHEVQLRCAEILDLIELKGYENRSVTELSGGQQQRVAIGRALSYRPQILLLDEPMGALDRKLRQQLGTDLRRIQQHEGITAIYVTHDQEEAFILSDQVAVMDGGHILQYGAPHDLYGSPENLFVASFLGETNLIVGSATLGDGNQVTLDTELGTFQSFSEMDIMIGKKYGLSIRPEDLQLRTQNQTDAKSCNELPCRVSDRIFLGNRYLVTCTARNNQVFAVEMNRRETIPEIYDDVLLAWQPIQGVIVNMTSTKAVQNCS